MAHMIWAISDPSDLLLIQSASALKQTYTHSESVGSQDEMHWKVLSTQMSLQIGLRSLSLIKYYTNYKA